MVGMELERGLERQEGQGFAAQLGEGNLDMRAKGKTPYPLACIFP